MVLRASAPPGATAPVNVEGRRNAECRMQNWRREGRAWKMEDRGSRMVRAAGAGSILYLPSSILNATRRSAMSGNVRVRFCPEAHAKCAKRTHQGEMQKSEGRMQNAEVRCGTKRRKPCYC